MTILVLALAMLARLPSPARAQTPPGEPRTDIASYALEATLDAAAKQIRGSGRITFINTGPDSLSEIWIRLYLNAFRSADTSWMREAAGGFRESVFDSRFPGWIRVEGLVDARTGDALTLPSGGDTGETIVQVPLAMPLPAGQKLELTVRWTSQLPKVFARTGFAGNFIFAGQWYPKLAAYDRGRWDTEPWHANSEFFADYGSYDLTLTVPAAYVTGANGVRGSETENADGTTTTAYHSERVTDVAWTAWPSFQRLVRTVIAVDKSVDIELLLPPGEVESADRHFTAARIALDSFSHWYGVYPWAKLTVVAPPPEAAGAGGMEYPGLVTTGTSLRLPFGLTEGIRDVEVTTVHEIAHQWFPMQVQSNESAEAWLDEGFADYLTIRALGRTKSPDASIVDLPFGRLGYASVQRALFLGISARAPVALPSWQYPSFYAYGATVYGKGSLALLTLERQYGDERFTAALRAYADRWRWRHPATADLQTSLESSLGQSLDSFFRGFIRGDWVVNYRVGSIEGTKAVIEREGEAPIPVDIRIDLADGGDPIERHWDGQDRRLDLDTGGRTIAAVSVDPENKLLLELDRSDNVLQLNPSPGPMIAAAGRWQGMLHMILQLVGLAG